MSAASLFRPGGDFYSLIPDPVFDLLEPAQRPNAIIVTRYLVKKEQAGELDERITDHSIANATGISQRSVQRALHALHVVLGQLGKPIIDRIHRHGRRIIEFVRGFAARGSSPPAPPIKTLETTTTREPSSSLGSIEEKTEQARPIAPPELVDRACRLIPEATPGKVAEAVAVHGVDRVRKALDRVEKRNANRDNKPVKSWGFVLNTLKNWEREGSTPPDDPPPATPPARVQAEPVKEEPSQRLTAQDVANLVELCQLPHIHPAQFARKQLAKALAEGAIPAELLSGIPEELREPTKPRAP
jgi:hypothetical protein